jgi:phage shock protein E
MFETAIRRASRVVLATTALASMILLGCTQAEPEIPSAGDAADDEVVVRSVTQQDVLDLVASDAPGTLLDVRSVAEFDSGHVPGALNIPVDELPQRLGELESGRADEVIVYCERGGRAMKAADLLMASGFRKLGHLEGDMSGWRAAGLPSE